MNIFEKAFGIAILAVGIFAISLYSNPRLYDANAQGSTPNDIRFAAMSVSDTSSANDWVTPTHTLSIYNSGTSTAYIDLIDGVATTANIPVYADMTINLKPFNNKKIAAICGSGESTTLTLYAETFNSAW